MIRVLLFLVAELSQRVAQAEAERSVDEREIVDLRHKCKELKGKNEENVIDQEMMNRVSIHLKEVEEMKRCVCGLCVVLGDTDELLRVRLTWRVCYFIS